MKFSVEAARFARKCTDGVAQSFGIVIVLLVMTWMVRNDPQGAVTVKTDGKGFEAHYEREQVLAASAMTQFQTTEHMQIELDSLNARLNASTKDNHDVGADTTIIASAPTPAPSSVASQVADVAKIAEASAQTEGVIFVGNVTDQSNPKFDPASLTMSSTSPIETPDDLKPGIVLTALRLVAVRKDFPKNDPTYYSSQPIIAALNTCQKCQLLNIDDKTTFRKYRTRHQKDQYWVKVRVISSTLVAPAS